MVKTALVTGGAGFIGGHLVDHLLREGWEVRVLDNLSSGSEEKLRGLQGKLEFIRGDVRDAEACQNACREVEYVFHMAAIASVASSVADPLTSHDVNLNGTLNMLMAARDQRVRRLVFASSASVYGDALGVPTAETEPLQPQSPYATNKACGEFYCRNFWELYGLETVVLRYFNVFGPGQNPVAGYAAVIPKFVECVATGDAPVVYGDGLQTRDFVYVGNVARANVLAATAPDAAGGIFNVAGGGAISLLDLLEALRETTGAPLTPDFRPARDGEVRHSSADISRARTVLGYEPEVGLSEGLRRTLEARLQQVPASVSVGA